LKSLFSLWLRGHRLVWSEINFKTCPGENVGEGADAFAGIFADVTRLIEVCHLRRDAVKARRFAVLWCELAGLVSCSTAEGGLAQEGFEAQLKALRGLCGKEVACRAAIVACQEVVFDAFATVAPEHPLVTREWAFLCQTAEECQTGRETSLSRPSRKQPSR
jgi:hypothetical protein